jgi:hypothetical protein
MEYVVVEDKGEFDRFVSFEVIEVKLMLSWYERSDYNVGDLVQVFFKTNNADQPVFIGRISEDLGAVEHVVEDINYHAFRIKRHQPDDRVKPDASV